MPRIQIDLPSLEAISVTVANAATVARIGFIDAGYRHQQRLGKSVFAVILGWVDPASVKLMRATVIR